MTQHSINLLKSVDIFTYIGRNITSTEFDVKIKISKNIYILTSALNKVIVIRKSVLSDTIFLSEIFLSCCSSEFCREGLAWIENFSTSRKGNINCKF